MSAVVEVADLSFGFRRERPVLSGVSFRVEAGECVALLGANGAGKSTLLWLVAGLMKGRGEVRLFGGKPSRAARGRIGMVFQNPEDQLFLPSLFDDLMLGLVNSGAGEEDARGRAMESLRRAGLEAEAGRPARELSLGQRKRAAIALALVRSPELVLLDEPTAELDGRSVRRLKEYLASLAVARVIATHHLEFARGLAERAILLADGRVAADGAAERILADRELLADAGLI